MKSVIDIYNDAKIDEYDIDAATSGLCATFALTFYRALKANGIEASIAFVCLRNKFGFAARNRKSQLLWRHAVVQVGDDLYDACGNVARADVIQEYCHPSRDGIVKPVSVKEALVVIRSTKNAYDRRYRNIWKAKFAA